MFDLLRAFEPLADDARLVLVGRGDEQRVRRRVGELGIGDAVTVDGEVPNDQLPGYYTAADVFCLPSYTESFGLVNLEAMACGTPVVTTDIPGISTYATDDETASLTTPGDIDGLRNALDTLVSAPARRERLGTAGRAVAESYSWEQSAKRFISLSEQLAD